MAASTEVLSATDLIVQAETIVDKINKDWKEYVKQDIASSREKWPNMTFVYLMSSSWLEQWKAMSGYEDILEGLSVNAKNLNLSKPLPRLNEDLVDEFMTKNLAKLSKYNPDLAFLDIVMKKGATEDADFVYANDQLWTYFKRWYPDAIEIKRKVYVNKHHEVAFEIYCHTVIFFDFRPTYTSILLSLSSMV